jgi:hypothetical protein
MYLSNKSWADSAQLDAGRSYVPPRFTPEDDMGGRHEPSAPLMTDDSIPSCFMWSVNASINTYFHSSIFKSPEYHELEFKQEIFT